jgi:hypothetical protein
MVLKLLSKNEIARNLKENPLANRGVYLAVDLRAMRYGRE